MKVLLLPVVRYNSIKYFGFALECLECDTKRNLGMKFMRERIIWWFMAAWNVRWKKSPMQGRKSFLNVNRVSAKVIHESIMKFWAENQCWELRSIKRRRKINPELKRSHVRWYRRALTDCQRIKSGCESSLMLRIKVKFLIIFCASVSPEFVRK